MKVVIKEEYKEAENKFNHIPKKDRGNHFMITAVDFILGKSYEVLEIVKHGWYRIIDESGEDYCYPPEMFEIVKE